MNIYSPHLDEVFESLKTFQPDLISLEQSGNLTPLQFDVPWNKGMSGYARLPHTEESKKKISEAKKGIPSKMRGGTMSEESKKKNRQSHLGKKLSQTTINKITESRTGQLHSDETKTKISNANKGKPSQLKGTTRPDDVKQKISEGKRGKKRVYREDGSFYMQ
jgi:hypothetical protein